MIAPGSEFSAIGEEVLPPARGHTCLDTSPLAARLRRRGGSQFSAPVSVGSGPSQTDWHYTFVQLDFLVRRGLIANVMMHSNSGGEGNFAGLVAQGERELGAFLKTVTDSFGTARAIEELELVPLAVRLNTAPSNTKVSPIRSSNCSVQGPLA
jgi:hypothetical protein